MPRRHPIPSDYFPFFISARVNNREWFALPLEYVCGLYANVLETTLMNIFRGPEENNWTGIIKKKMKHIQIMYEEHSEKRSSLSAKIGLMEEGLHILTKCIRKSSLAPNKCLYREFERSLCW